VGPTRARGVEDVGEENGGGEASRRAELTRANFWRHRATEWLGALVLSIPGGFGTGVRGWQPCQGKLTVDAGRRKQVRSSCERFRPGSDCLESVEVLEGRLGEGCHSGGGAEGLTGRRVLLDMMDASSQWSAVSQRIVMMLIDVSMNTKGWDNGCGPKQAWDPLSQSGRRWAVNESTEAREADRMAVALTLMPQERWDVGHQSSIRECSGQLSPPPGTSIRRAEVRAEDVGIAKHGPKAIRGGLSACDAKVGRRWARVPRLLDGWEIVDPSVPVSGWLRSFEIRWQVFPGEASVCLCRRPVHRGKAGHFRTAPGGRGLSLRKTTRS